MDQLIASKPVLSNSTYTKLVYVHHEQGRLFQFLIGLRDEFESARSHILHQDPLPTISQAIHKLVDDETRLQTDPISIQTMVLATPAAVPQTAAPVFPLPVHLPMFPNAKGIMSDDITIRSLFLFAVSVRIKVIKLKLVILVNVFFKTSML